MQERQRVLAKKKEKRYFDYSLLLLTAVLVCFGFVMIYSSSSYNSQIRYNDPFYYMKKQVFSSVLGFFVMILISHIDYRLYIKKLRLVPIKLATLAYLVAIALQVFVLVFGHESNGAKRWLYIGPISFQPSEFSKVATILFVAYIVYLAPSAMKSLGGILRVMILMGPLIALIASENMSTAIIICIITVGICFVASKNRKLFVIVAIVIAVLGVAYIFLGEGFRVQRIDIWRNVETHPRGFQILQGLYAIASGGLFGTGLGQSMQKLGFIPESHNDMIFSIICEELGLLGAIVVILLFVLLIWRIFIIAISAPDLYGGLICSGVLVHIASQVIINIAVVTNTIPSTGIPMPFISYGGTSVAILIAEMGLVLSVSRQIRTQN